jgi:hypothetical protein
MTTELATPYDIWPLLKQAIPDLPEHVFKFKLEFDFRVPSPVTVEVGYYVSVTEICDPITKRFNLIEEPS